MKIGTFPKSRPPAGLHAAVLAAVLACPGMMRAGEIRPGEFESLARRSVNILDTYRAYHKAFEEKRGKRYDTASGELVNRKGTFLLFLETNVLAPELDGEREVNGVELRTDEGIIQSSMQKSYGAVNLSYFHPEYEAGLYVIADLLQLFTMEVDNPDKRHLFKGGASNEALDFSAGFLVVSGFISKGNRGIHLGSLLRFEPITQRDSLTGQRVFRFERQPDGTYDGSRIRPELFARYHDGRYDVSTLYSLRSGIELVGLGLVQRLPHGFEVDPFLRYFQYRTRFQAGAGVRKTLFERLDSEIEFANDLHRNSAGRFEYFHHLIVRNSLAFFRMKREELPMHSRYDFYMTLDYTYSLSSDILDERVTGHSGGLALENIFGFLSLFYGMGYNEYRYLSIFPFKDSFTVDFKAQIGW